MKEIELEVENEKKGHHFFRTLFFIIILIIILIIIYAKFLGNSGFVLKEYQIKDSIPESFNNLRIAHFSDILYNNDEDIEVFDDIIKKINDKKVDIIIFSGNLTKGKYKFNEKESNKVIEKLSKLESKYGKYYVSGMEDKKNPSYDSIMNQSGFISLNDNKDIIYSKTKEQLLLVGVDNNSPTSFINDIIKDYNGYKIVIFSESDEIEEIKDYNFNVALSSNSLNGQINIPIVKEFFLRDGSKKYISPYYKVGNTKLYLRSGIGTDKIDFRLFNKPSGNIYSFKAQKNM